MVSTKLDREKCIISKCPKHWARSISNDRLLLLFLLLIPYIEPQIFKTPEFYSWDSVFDIAKLASAVVIFILYLRETRRPASYVILMAGAQTWILLSTLVNDGSITRFAGPAITSVVIIMLGEMVMSRDPLKFLSWLRNLLTAFFIINAVTWLLIELPVPPFGGLPTSFLGIDNRWIYFLLPWVVITFFVSASQTGKADAYSWVVYLAAMIQVAAVWSVGVMISLLLWPLIWFWQMRRLDVKGTIGHPVGLLCFAFAANFLLISGELLELLGPFISEALGKGPTLSGRTHLWDVVLAVLSENPLFGMGVQTESFDKQFFFVQSGYVEPCAVNHPHNYILNVAYHGGLVAAVLFVAVYALALRDMSKNRSSVLVGCMLCGMLVFFVASLVDTLDFSLMYLLIPIAAKAGSKVPQQPDDAGEGITRPSC